MHIFLVVQTRNPLTFISSEELERVLRLVEKPWFEGCRFNRIRRSWRLGARRKVGSRQEILDKGEYLNWRKTNSAKDQAKVIRLT
jgi:hypothetical protein